MPVSSGRLAIIGTFGMIFTLFLCIGLTQGVNDPLDYPITLPISCAGIGYFLGRLTRMFYVSNDRERPLVVKEMMVCVPIIVTVVAFLICFGY